MVDPHEFPLAVDEYRRPPHDWLDELDTVAVHVGEPHQRMGTRAVDAADWLRADRHRQEELALRARLVAEARDEVFAALPGSEAACREAAALVDRWTESLADPSPRPGDGADEQHPLIRAALSVQEDLCLMERTDDGWCLTAAVVCFPSYWRLADKIGRPQEEVHGPVPHFQTDLAAKVTRFFDRLPPGRIVARRNWGFTAHPLLFAPDLAALGPPGTFSPDHVWLRSERQTLRRLPETGAVLFTILVQLAPGTALVDRHDLAARLLAAMDAWSPELIASRGGRHGWMGDLSSWLRGFTPA